MINGGHRALLREESVCELSVWLQLLNHDPKSLLVPSILLAGLQRAQLHDRPGDSGVPVGETLAGTVAAFK